MSDIGNLNIAITATGVGGSQDIGRIAYLSRTVNLFQGNEQIIDTIPELLLIVPSVPAFIYIKNLGSTNVTIDSVSTMNAFPQRIVPGGSVCLLPQTVTIYALSDAPNGRIWVMSFY